MFEEDEQNDRYDDEHTIVGDIRQAAFDSKVEVERFENAERESINEAD